MRKRLTWTAKIKDGKRCIGAIGYRQEQAINRKCMQYFNRRRQTTWKTTMVSSKYESSLDQLTLFLTEQLGPRRELCRPYLLR